MEKYGRIVTLGEGNKTHGSPGKIRRVVCEEHLVKTAVCKLSSCSNSSGIEVEHL